MALAPSSAGLADRLRTAIREIPDFPEPGVLFRDLGPALADADLFRALVAGLIAPDPPPAADTPPPDGVDVVVAIEARGFLLGAAAAQALGAGVVAVRKPGKLPLVADRQTYALEYGSATLELPDGALRPGQRVLVIDDVLATGGTVAATCALVERAGGTVERIAVAVEIAALGGRIRLPGRSLRALLTV